MYFKENYYAKISMKWILCFLEIDILYLKRFASSKSRKAAQHSLTLKRYDQHGSQKKIIMTYNGRKQH